MPELVLELGCEELPATAVRRAYEELDRLIKEGLTEAGIPFEAGSAPIGTPRRLIVHLANVAADQPDQSKEVRGPGVAAAYGPDGQPSKALEGFCRGQGVDVASVEQRDGYVWAVRVDKGRPTQEVLSELIPKAVRGLTFDKTMRWGSSRMRFARPIRWIVALFGGEIVPFDIEGVHSGNQSRGHRFYAPDAFDVTSYDQLLTELLKRKVEPNPDERRTTIREVATVTATGKPDISEALLEENVFLTEWPTPIEGTFPADYLELPEPVLVTAMAKHEKMFPVRDGSGSLLNKFIFVRNGGEDDAVREGTAWVLRARFNDAKFFFDEDKKKDLLEFHAETERLVFQEKLGSVHKRADRLAHLAQIIAERLGFDGGEQTDAQLAGLYAKADLSTGLVSELASLQGIVGGLYAKRHGLSDRVCQAIGRHYDLEGIRNQSESANRVALCVLLADQIDKLAGYLGIGQAPSGSSDPFGLRRATSYLIEGTWDHYDIDLGELLKRSVESYENQGISLDRQAAQDSFEAILAQRYTVLLSDERYDCVAAALERYEYWPASRPMDVLRRLDAINKLANNRDFVQTATRPLNILRSAMDKGIAVEPISEALVANLNSQLGTDLWAQIKSIQLPASAEALLSLKEPIHAFFEATMIMSNEPTEQTARLALVRATAEVLRSVGDFTKIVLEGE